MSRLKRNILISIAGLFHFGSGFASSITEWDITTTPVELRDVQIQRDDFDYFSNQSQRLAKLPALNFRLEKSKRLTLKPLQNGIITLPHPGWDIILREASRFDTGALRGGKLIDVISITLMEKGQNCLHYGRLTFPSVASLVGDVGAQNVKMQSGEFSQNIKGTLTVDGGTCLYLKFTATADVNVRLAQKTAAAVENKLFKPLAVKPIRAVEADFPGVNASAFRQPESISYNDLTLYGAVINGVHYVSQCQGRANCDTLPVPSYSLAKSLVGSLALMRLEKLYPNAKHALLSDYVEACKNWQGVTFSHLLNMTSGHYRSSRPHVDESRFFWAFANQPSAQQMTDYACQFPQKSEAGESWVYRTSDTWLLGVAMQRFLAEKTGETADFYRDLLLPIWDQLKLSSLLQDSLRADDIPYTGWGLVLTRDDIAKIALAVASRDPSLTALLDTALFNHATQYQGGPTGSKAGSNFLRYASGFWAWNASRSLNCESPAWLPVMSGFGGVSVVMLPTGDVFYYFSDSGEFTYAEPVKALHQINPICE